MSFEDKAKVAIEAVQSLLTELSPFHQSLAEREAEIKKTEDRLIIKASELSVKSSDLVIRQDALNALVADLEHREKNITSKIDGISKIATARLAEIDRLKKDNDRKHEQLHTAQCEFGNEKRKRLEVEKSLATCLADKRELEQSIINLQNEIAELHKNISDEYVESLKDKINQEVLA